MGSGHLPEPTAWVKRGFGVIRTERTAVSPAGRAPGLRLMALSTWRLLRKS